jgi:hypothetical protein
MEMAPLAADRVRRTRWALACVGVGLVMGTLASCAGRAEDGGVGPGGRGANAHDEAALVASPTLHATTPRDYPGLHNVVAYHEGLFSGGMPEGERGLGTLASMGVRTIISVDGAAPDASGASRLGMRYIHLPIGYNGFDEARRLELSRATRDAIAVGPVYIHCHHGKHRSAGAAATIAASLGWRSAEFGVERMRVSGTSPAYKGLYARALGASVIAMPTLDRVPPEFPSVWRTTDLVKGMVEIDRALEHLLDIQRAGWSAPMDHPDLVPVAEAGRLADLYRMLAEGEYTKRQREGFGGTMHDAWGQAQELEDALASEGTSAARLDDLLARVAASCKDCHTQFRD